MIVIYMWILHLQVSTSCLLCTHLTINRAGFCWTSRFSNSQSCKYCKNNGKFTSVFFFCRNDDWKYFEIESTLKFVHEILDLVALLLDSIIASDKAMNCLHAYPLFFAGHKSKTFVGRTHSQTISSWTYTWRWWAKSCPGCTQGENCYYFTNL